MRTRRARPEDLEAVGEVTVAAYAEFEGDDTDEYVHHLRDAATRDREAELWVATPDDSEEILGTVTICPPGSPWREVARRGRGRVPDARRRPGRPRAPGSAPRCSTWSSTTSGARATRAS